MGLLAHLVRNSEKITEIIIQTPILLGFEIFTIEPDFLTYNVAIEL